MLHVGKGGNNGTWNVVENGQMNRNDEYRNSSRNYVDNAQQYANMTMQRSDGMRNANESPANDPNSVWQRRAYGNNSRASGNGYRSFVNVYVDGSVMNSLHNAMLKSSGQTEEAVTKLLKPLACLDSGCNEYAVFNDPAYFPFDLTTDHDVRMKVADDFDKKMGGVGTAYLVLEGEDMEPIRMKIEKGAYRTGPY